MNSPKRILFYGDYGRGVNTGFATVLKNIRPEIKRLQGDSVTHSVCAMNYHDKAYQDEDGTWIYPAFPNHPAYPEDDLYGRINLAKMLKDQSMSSISSNEDVGFDLVFMLHDIGVILPYAPLFKEMQQEMRFEKRKPFKSVFYFPVDREYDELNLNLKLERDWGLNFFDLLITYNEYSRKQIIKHRPDLQHKLKVIPHGVDTKTFHPLPIDEKREFRRQYFGRNADKFIICNVNRNQHRKDIPATIFSFVEYKKINPNSFLYLHMHPDDPMGWNIRAVMLTTGLIEGTDYAFPPERTVNINGSLYNVYDTEEDVLNKIYNACDVYLTTTRGEGWGLGVLESMACRLPVICPLNTSFFEITDSGRRAYLLENQYPIASRADNVIRGQIDPDEAAEVLNQVHNDINREADQLHRKVDAAYNYATSLTWESISEKWFEIFKKLL